MPLKSGMRKAGKQRASLCRQKRRTLRCICLNFGRISADILRILPFVLRFAARYFLRLGVVVDGLGLASPMPSPSLAPAKAFWSPLRAPFIYHSRHSSVMSTSSPNSSPVLRTSASIHSHSSSRSTVSMRPYLSLILFRAFTSFAVRL